ncbi:MAG TPA: hypothetical protein VGF87_09675 [Acidimicrobiales bacterium]
MRRSTKRLGFTLLPLLGAAILAAPIAGPAAQAATAPPPAPLPPSSAAGILYPVTSFLDWAENPINNVTNPTLGEYALLQMVDEAQAAVLAQFPDEIASLTLTAGPNVGADAEAFSEQMVSQLVHLRPRIAGADETDIANPYFLPDFDHNGVYGDPGDYTNANPDVSPNANGYFLYPCISDTGAVTYETTSGTCAAAGTAGDTYQEGLAQEETIVDSRGLNLAATLWLPGQALKAGCPQANPNANLCSPSAGLAARNTLDGGQGLPMVVIAEGLASAQNCYYWLAMTLAKAGYVVLTYDPAGQGASDGSAADLFEPPVPTCEFGGACRDLEDVMRWVVGDPIHPVVDLATAQPVISAAAPAGSTSEEAGSPPNPDIHNPAYAPAGSNILDPAISVINTAKIGAVGHSMGGLAVLNYLYYQGKGSTGVDGNPLPPLASAISLSSAAATSAVVPLQIQTSDFDGSPTLVGPAVGGIDFGAAGEGIGYSDVKPMYDQLRTEGPGSSALSLIVLEGGVHTDFIDTPFITRTPWSLSVSAHYATDWMNCTLDSNFFDCLDSVVAVPHLSSSFASEAAPPAGPTPHPSYCITIPTTASLDDSPPSFFSAETGHPAYTCTPL